MTAIAYSYTCSSCGKHSRYDGHSDWVELIESSAYDLQSYRGDTDLGKYYLCPKCRANILGKLTKFVAKQTTIYEQQPGWIYQSDKDIPYEVTYNEDLFTHAITICGDGSITMQGKDEDDILSFRSSAKDQWLRSFQ